MVGVLRWFVAPLMVGRAVLVCGPPLGGACCVGAYPPRWWCVVWLCLAWVVVVCWVGCGCGCVFLVAGVNAVLVRAPPPLFGRAVFVRAPPMVGRALLVCAPPHRGACCIGLWPPSWWGVLCWCVAPLLVGRAVLVAARRGGGAWFGGVRLWLPLSVGWVAVAVVLFAWRGLVLCRCVPPPPLLGRPVFVRGPHLYWGVLCRRVRVLVRGVVAGSMLGLFCWFAIVSAAVRPALPGVGCLWRLPGRGVVLCCRVSPPLLGRALFVRGPPHGGACPVGLCPPPPWWDMLRWFVAALMVGHAVLVRGPSKKKCFSDALGYTLVVLEVL